jgi:hypothetical protein
MHSKAFYGPTILNYLFPPNVGLSAGNPSIKSKRSDQLKLSRQGEAIPGRIFANAENTQFLAFHLDLLDKSGKIPRKCDITDCKEQYNRYKFGDVQDHSRELLKENGLPEGSTVFLKFVCDQISRKCPFTIRRR